jgi:hypothetical protein
MIGRLFFGSSSVFLRSLIELFSLYIYQKPHNILLIYLLKPVLSGVSPFQISAMPASICKYESSIIMIWVLYTFFTRSLIISATEYPNNYYGRDLSEGVCVYEEYSTITALSSGFGVTKPNFVSSFIKLKNSFIQTQYSKPETTLNGSLQLHFQLNSFNFISQFYRITFNNL